jgi:nicotinamidase-related amidase
MQKSFAEGKTPEAISQVASKVSDTIKTMRKHAATGRAHVFYTQHGYLNGTTCDHHANYKRHWASRGAGADCSSMAIGDPDFDFIDQLEKPNSDSNLEPVLRKEVYDAFHGSQLHSLLQQRGVNTVAISGWESNICCDSTARAAFFYGYRVIFLSDGTDTSDGEAVHNATVTNLDWIAADAMTCCQFTDAVDATLNEGGSGHNHA